MPELPELEVVREVLTRRVVGRQIESVEVSPPGGAIVIRNLIPGDFSALLNATAISTVSRRGKYLLFSLTGSSADPFWLVINFKLTGRLQLASPGIKKHAKTHVIFTLLGGDASRNELRYVDQKRMGQLYLTRDLTLVPEFSTMGPDALEISYPDFRERLRAYRGEIKGILTRGEFVAGIGNAYADEILWAARLHPFRKRTQLTPAQTETLHAAMLSTLVEATVKLRAEMGENIHLKPRDFMAVHMKTGDPCPRCGSPVSLVGANQRITNFCRTCQPGGLIRGM